MNSYILLRVNNTNYKLDLLGNEKINYNFLISDIKDISKKRTNFSKTISLPGTKNNNDIFNNIFEVTSDSNFNPNKSVNCQLVVDGVPIISGFLKLNKIGFDNLNTVINYDVIIYGGNFNIANSLGDLKLYELDLSDWNHTINAQTIFNSWSGETPYVYPLVDYGKYFTLDNINMQTPPTDMVEYMDLNPWLKVNSVLYKLFNYAGYSIQSNFLSGEFFNSLIFNTGTKLKYTTDELKNDLFRAELTGTQTADVQNPQQLGGSFYLSSVTISDDYTVGYDYGNNYNTSTGQIIFSGNTRGTGLTTSFEIGLKFKNNSFATNQINYVIRLYLYNNGVPIWNNGSYINVNANNIGNTWIFTTPEFTVSRTDVLQFKIDAAANYPAGALQLEAPSYITNNYGVVDDWLLAGETVRINNFINKEVKAIDFVSSIFKTFNLYVEQSSTDPFTYVIEPRNQFYLGGQIKDWTNKLDSSVEIQQTLLSELQSRKFKFTWRADTDYLNKNYTEKYDGDIYGQEELTVDNDFLDFNSELKIEPIFTPLFSRIIPGSTKIVTPIFYDVDGGQIKFRESVPLKLACYKVLNSERYILATNRVAPNSGWAEPFYLMDSYCYAGSIYPSVANPQFNLNFGTPEVTQFLGSAYTQSGLVYPVDNIYTEYWEDTINEITDKNNRLITCSMYLTPADITNLSFRNTIKLKINGNTSYYKLNAIRDYNPLNNEPCKVELIKSENAVPAPKIYRRINRLPDVPTDVGRINLGHNNQLINPFSLAVGNNNIIESPSSVVFGNSNSSKGLNSISIGEYNTASTKSIIIGGSGNTTEGKYSAIIAGRNNTIQSRYTTEDNNIIIGGSDNLIRFRNTDNIIIGSTGSEIRTTGITNSVIIGSNNSVLQNDATNAVILGGENIIAVSANTTYLQRGVITEFYRGELPADSARMVTTDKYGYLQPLTLSGTNGITIQNSGGNIIWSYTGSTGGGSGSGDYWTGSTGFGSIVRNVTFTNNIIAGDNSIITAGKNNYISSDQSIIGSGRYNSVYSIYSAILTGKRNTINSFNKYSSILCGSGNTLAGTYSSILGGKGNTATGNFTSVLNGFNNSIQADAYGSCEHNIIIGGVNNKVYGTNNLVKGTTTIVSGNSNTVLTGNQHKIYAGGVTILSGIYNRDYSLYGYNLIGGGRENHHQLGSNYSTIIHGHYNHSYGTFGTIINGKHNYLFGVNSNDGSLLRLSHSTILNGYRNTTLGKYQTITNGLFNCLTSGATGSTIISLNYFTGTSENTLFTDSIQARSLTGSTTRFVTANNSGTLSAVTLSAQTKSNIKVDNSGDTIYIKSSYPHTGYLSSRSSTNVKRYYNNTLTFVSSFGNVNPGANQIRLFPFVVNRSMQIQEAGVNVTVTATTNGSFALALYNSLPGELLPYQKLLDFGSANTTSTGIKLLTGSTAVTIEPGLYWFGFNTNSSAQFSSPASGLMNLGSTNTITTTTCSLLSAATYSVTFPNILSGISSYQQTAMLFAYHPILLD